MPGITLIGDSRNGSRRNPTTLAAETRRASRLLGFVKSPQLASEVLVESLDVVRFQRKRGLGLTMLPERNDIQRIRQSLSETLAKMGKHGWHLFAPGQAEKRMALALQYTIEIVMSGKTLSQSKPQWGGPSIHKNKEEDPRPANRSRLKMATPSPAVAVVSGSSSSSAGVTSDEGETTSDNEAGAVAETATAISSLERARTIKQFWAVILESLHLQVASRTTRSWGKKKKYEIYQLCSPAKSVTELMDVTHISQGIEREFRTIFHGGTEDQSGCRTYALLRPMPQQENQSCLYIQMNIGKCYDLQDEGNRASCGEKKKKKPTEYVAVVIPGSSLIAVRASRSARFTKYVLTALESVLSSVRNVAALGLTTTSIEDDSLVPERYGGWTGTEPHELLESAQAAQMSHAVGRFARYASAAGVDGLGQADPLLELQSVATSSLIDRSDEKKRLKTGAQHGRRLAQLEKQASQGSGGVAALVAANDSGSGILVDHSAGQKRSRKRARDQDLGRAGDCPQRQRITWKWKGETTAAAACWYDNEDEIPGDLPKTKFKCAVVMEGPNVFEGLRALVAAGLAKAPLPDFVRDAPRLGSATVTVDGGEFAGSGSFAAV